MTPLPPPATTAAADVPAPATAAVPPPAADGWHGVRPLGVRGPLPPEVEAHQRRSLHDAFVLLEAYGIQRDALLRCTNDGVSQARAHAEKSSHPAISMKATCSRELCGGGFDVGLQMVFPSPWSSRCAMSYANVPLPMYQMCAVIVESDLVPWPRWKRLPQIEIPVLHRFAANDLLFNPRVAPFAVFDGSDSVQDFKAYALPQPGHMLVYIHSPPEGATSWRGVPLPPPGPRRKRNLVKGCVWLLRPSDAHGGARVDVDVFLSEELPVPAWLIPPALVRLTVPPLAAKIVAAWQSMTSDLASADSAIGARMREDGLGFYAALREWLGQWRAADAADAADAAAAPGPSATPSQTEAMM
jgi:hypothetical protein